jgi:histidyl-tRNA synthetase
LLVGGKKIGGGGRYDDLIPLMSGKNIPACGFALYIDPLMRFLPLENEVSEKSRILVSGKKTTPKIVRNCFSIAQKLREAMYIVEIDFSKEEPSAYRWVISVSENETCPFTVLDSKQKQQREVASLSEILSIIGG